MTRKPRSPKRAIQTLGLALVASLALSALAAGSASAATQHWYKCQLGAGELNYKDSICNEEVAPGFGSYGLTKLTEGTETGFAMTGTSPLTLKWKLGGAAHEVVCLAQTSKEGTVINPTGGGAGTAFANVELSSCTVVKPTGCTIKPLGASLNGEATEFGGHPAINFTSYGPTLFEMFFEGSKCVWSGKTFVFTGGFTGMMIKSGSLKFTEAGSAISMGGNAVKLIGTSKLENASGEALVLAP